MASDGLNALVELLRSNPIEGGDDVLARRASMEAMAGMQPLPDDVTVEPVDANGVPCERVAAAGAAADRWLLYLHGGAYTAGSLTTHRTFCATLSRATGATVLNVGYRLAPEHAHPAAVDDAVTAWRWFLADGADAGRTVV
ncbi:MAG: alpha/beta hydrolase fold domain-containing protein, partial [Acidimicrobiia bacterium]|nr:alpha/beta hydrolase fold domain-containing protein [Acidimicrobiia bacterium]